MGAALVKYSKFCCAGAIFVGVPATRSPGESVEDELELAHARYVRRARTQLSAEVMVSPSGTFICDRGNRTVALLFHTLAVGPDTSSCPNGRATFFRLQNSRCTVERALISMWKMCN